MQGGLGSADDVEHVADLLSNSSFSRVLNSVSLFFKSTYSLKSNQRVCLNTALGKNSAQPNTLVIHAILSYYPSYSNHKMTDFDLENVYKINAWGCVEILPWSGLFKSRLTLIPN